MRKADMAAAVGLSAFALSSPALAVDCDGLRSAKIADTTIISAEAVPTGDLTTADKVTRKDMPAICRVVASVKDAHDSDVRVELWMPNDRWKGVFPRQRQRWLRGCTRLQLRRDGSRDKARTRHRGDRPRNGAGDPTQRRRPRRSSG